MILELSCNDHKAKVEVSAVSGIRKVKLDGKDVAFDWVRLSEGQPVTVEKPQPAKPAPKAPETADPADKPKSRIISESEAPTIVSSRTEVLEAKNLASLAPDDHEPALTATSSAPSTGSGGPGEPYKGTYVASTGVNIRDKPSASGKKVESSKSCFQRRSLHQNIRILNG